MEDGFVDVENIDPQQAPLVASSSNSQPKPAAPRPVVPNPTRRSTRPRQPAPAYTPARPSQNDRTSSIFKRNTRLTAKQAAAAHAAHHHGPGPKLKIKMGERGAGQGTSFLGPWDRDLDSDDEDLAFEEQFILRMPEGEHLEELRKMVAARSVTEDVWFKFKDSRRALFHIGDTTYNAKLVDLPAVIESQKTLDNRQLFKVADICQMLVIEDVNSVDGEDQNGGGAPPSGDSKAFDAKDFIWPHGLTPPMRHARKRRFRKRINRATIETVEKEVERLLKEDDAAEKTTWSLHSSHSEAESDYDGSNLFDAGTPAFDPGSPQIEDDETRSIKQEGGADDMDFDDAFDAAFAAEIDQVDMEAEAAAYADDESQSSDEEEDDDDLLFGDEDEDDESEEDEDEDEETQAARRLLNEEIRDLEAAVEKKISEIATVQNVLIKRRFEDALKKLQADLDSRLLQRQQMSERKLAQDQARAQIELDSLQVADTAVQAPPAEEPAADEEEEEEETDEDGGAGDDDDDGADEPPASAKDVGGPATPLPNPLSSGLALNANPYLPR
ncbi:hypothetical protein DL93DRAFT_2087391 [Clavulina sp. PMI_390]|nr:hypothetical protein DL93DRAFT_2087391 [Clavulina sp. PMI_390]